MNHFQVPFTVSVALSIFLGWDACSAQTIIPQIGGGQTGMSVAPMKHADVSFDGTSIHVSVDSSVEMPVLRSLNAGVEFEAEQPWSVLRGKAYNFQYGWNPGGFIALPPGTWIWIEQLEAASELEVYQRPPAAPSYDRIFGSDGAIWRWPGSMTHNAYAITKPQQDEFEAIYRVYIGDESSGAELSDTDGSPMYGSDTVTFRFGFDLIGDFDENGLLDVADIDILSAGVRAGEYTLEMDLTQDDSLDVFDRDYWLEELVGTRAGDADLNGAVEFADFLSLTAGFGSESGWSDGDFDGNGVVGFADFLLLSEHFGKTTAFAASVPEPASWVLVVLAMLLLVRSRLAP